MIDDISKYLSDPLVLGGVVAGGLLLLLVLLWLLFRGRKGGDKSEAQIRQELASMERETQVSGIAAQVPFQDSPEAVARGIAAVCKDYLSLPVFKIYAGRHSDNEYLNVLPKPEDAVVTNDLAQSAALPTALPAPLVRGFSRPQAVNINALIGEAATGTGQGVTVLPWQGAFGWSGLLVAGAMNSNPAETLAAYQEALALLGNKLAVALEMASSKTAAPASGAAGGAAKTAHFYQTIFMALDGQATLDEIVETAAGMLNAESAALWLYDTNTQMLTMQSFYGLRAAEFLPLPAGQGLAGNVLETRTPLALADAPSDPRCIFPREAKESGIGSYLGVPVLVDGAAVGVLEAHTEAPKYWTDEAVETLESAALALATVLKRQTPAARDLQSESAYFALSEALQRLRAPEELLEAVVEVFGNALNVSRVVALDLRDLNGSTVRYEYRAEGTKPALGATFADALVQKAALATTDESGAGVPVVAAEAGARSLLGDEAANRLDVVSELVVPVREQDKTRALIFLHQCDRVRAWHADEREFVNRVSRQLALSLAHLDALRAVEKAAVEKPEKPVAAPEAASAAADATRSQAALNSLPEAVIGLDREGRLTFFNRLAQGWLELRAEDIGRPVSAVAALAMTDSTMWSRVITSTGVARFEAKLKRSEEAQTLSQSLLLADDAPEMVSLAVAPVGAGGDGRGGFLVVISDISHVPSMAVDVMSRIAKLREQQAEIERNIADAKAAEMQARARIERLNALEGGVKDGGQAARRLEEEWLRERQQFRVEKERLENSLQQMLDTNKLKSEFIVNCGHEIEASVQSTMGIADLLEKGAYGALTPQQRQAVREILNFGNRIKGDIASLIEYGAARIR